MIIDSDDEETTSKIAPQLPPVAEFEDEDEELDPDQPYPSIIQNLLLPLNTQVLHIAVPNVPAVSALRPADSVPPIFNKKIVFTVACADFSVRLISLPLSPPSNAAKELPGNTKLRWGEEIVRIPTHAGHQTIPRGVAVTWTSRTEPAFDKGSDEEMDIDAGEDTAATPGRRKARQKQSRSRSSRGGSEGWDLLVASHSTEVGGLLKIWRLSLTETSITAPSPFLPYQTLTLRAPATRVAFNSALYPKGRHSQLLIADSSGIVRIYDPFAIPSRKRRAASTPEPGGYVAIFKTTFEAPQSNVLSAPVLAARKLILDAAWASDGHSIVALLGDGEWGIWDMDRMGPHPPADPSTFSIRGFVGSTDGSRSGGAPSSPKARNSRTSLAPMTPNTRRTKEENLFHGTSQSSSIPTRGGISIASLPPTNEGAPEESVLLWYGTDIYRIANLGQFWSRTASSGDSSLSRPALSKMQGLALFGEAITSVHQFDTTTKEARMAVPRDTLVSTDHRLIILTTTTQPLGWDLNAPFDKEQAEEEETRRTDQALLARGELDLGGMDRLLEDMEGSGQRSLVLGNPRKVLFASSTS